MSVALADVLVAKIGGSLAGAGELRQWLGIFEATPVRMVVVPGGGPFADAVRAAQGPMGYDDRAAHEMALLAMTQYGVALASLCRKAALVADREEISAALAMGALPVWSPGRMALADMTLAASWDVTSDSLAAWLAGRLGSERLLLVKRADPRSGQLSDLARDGMVDRQFTGFLARSGARGWMAGPADIGVAAGIFASGGVPGRPILLPPPIDLA